MADYFVQYSESYAVTPMQQGVAHEIYNAIEFVWDEFIAVYGDYPKPGTLPEDYQESDEARRHLEVFHKLSDDLRLIVEEDGLTFTLMSSKGREGVRLHIQSDEGMGMSMRPVLYFLSEVLEWTDDHTTWTMTWSVGCSKMRAGSFGGGAAVVDLNNVILEDTWDTVGKLHEQLKERYA